MTLKEFKEYITELQNVYDKKFNDTQIQVWYENLKFMSVERFNYILAEFYKTSQFMPSLADILEKHKSIPYEEKKEETSGMCKKCNNTGYITYTKELNGYPYTYVATCSCKRQQPYEDEKYKMKTAEELGFTEKPKETTEEEIINAMVKLSNSGMVSEQFKQMMRENIRKRRVRK